jgi:hypothetical protein
LKVLTLLSNQTRKFALVQIWAFKYRCVALLPMSRLTRYANRQLFFCCALLIWLGIFIRLCGASRITDITADEGTD